MKHKTRPLPKPKTYNYKQIQDAFWSIYNQNKPILSNEEDMTDFFHQFINKLNVTQKEIDPPITHIERAYWATFGRDGHSVFEDDYMNERTSLYWREFLYNLNYRIHESDSNHTGIKKVVNSNK